ncbi:MAG: hypothetical protein H2172_12395 [Opitutus sp.]|nr:hypothetical protein [Opitutus sp.]
MSLLNHTPFTVAKTDGTHEQLALGRLSIRNLYLFAQKLAATDGVGLVVLATVRAPTGSIRSHRPRLANCTRRSSS